MWQPDDQQASERLKTLVKNVQQSDTKAISKPLKQCTDAVADWLSIYAKVYPQNPLSPELVLAYKEGLGYLSEKVAHEAFKLAMIESASGRRGFMPSPGEVAEASERVEKGEPKNTANPDCRACSGVGFELIPDPECQQGSSYRVAIPCRECRKAEGGL